MQVARFKNTKAFVHPTAEVSDSARLADGVRIWLWCQIREEVSIGENTIVGSRSLIEPHVSIGKNVKIQSGVSVCTGVTILDGVFIGPSVCFTNDKFPRAITPAGALKTNADWVTTPTQVGYGAAVGAGSVVVCGVTIGKWAMVGAGAVVTKSIPDFALVYGNPARIKGYVCPCGKKFPQRQGIARCPQCASFTP